MHSQRRWKRQRWWAAIAAVAAASTFLLTACGGGASAGAAITPASGQQLPGFPGTPGPPAALPTAMPSGSSMADMPTSAAPPTSAPVAANSVAIHNFAFGPQGVTVKAGTTVHWTNNDTEPHTVTSDTGAFNSPVLQPGASYSFTFTKPGTYSYHCTIHPFMTAKVMVS